MILATALLSLALATQTLAQCGRIPGDTEFFCSDYFTPVGDYFSTFSPASREDGRIQNSINFLTANAEISATCTEYVATWLCARSFQKCLPEDSGTYTNDAQRLVFICRSSCQTMATLCPSMFEPGNYNADTICTGASSNTQDDPDAVCYDILTGEIQNSDLGSDSAAAAPVALAASLVAVAGLALA